jgi:cytochrome c-type biogenesis protein
MVSLPLAALAFSSGMITFVNPCGFALLPVYITYYFKNEGLEKSSVAKRIFAGLGLGLIVSLGFAAVFLLMGFIVNYIGNGVLRYVGWFDFFIGILLMAIGLIYLFNLNSKIKLNKLTNFGEKLKSNKLSNKYSSFFLYGTGFAIASLGCTLPIFLLIVTFAAKAGGFVNTMLVFLIYAAGMSLFMVLFSVAIAFSKSIIEKTLKRWIPYIYKFGAIIVIFAGAYLIYNQVVLGKLLG